MKEAETTRCKAQTKAGKPCRAAATRGGLCFFHANPNKASELGRIGGRKNRHTVAANAEPLPTLDNAIAVRNTVNRLIDDVYSGKVDPKTASGLASLLTLQLRAIGTADLERSVAELQKQLAEVTVRQNNAIQPKPHGNAATEDGSSAEKPLRYAASTMG
jgi:hypothetical protein